MSDDENGASFINIAPGRKMKVKTVEKPAKTNPYVEPPFFNNNFMNSQSPRPERDTVSPMREQPRQAPSRDQNPGFIGSANPPARNENSYRKGTPERQSLLKEQPDDSYIKASPQQYQANLDEEEEPEAYAIFEDDMHKIKKFKDDYGDAFEKDKEADRKLTVQQVKINQLVEHSNQLVDKKDEFRTALMEVMKENAKLEQRNDEIEEDIKELEEAIEKGIKLVNYEEEEDEKNLNLFMVGDPAKLHEMKIERERRKLKRALINALDYMEGKEARLTGIKEHKTACQRCMGRVRRIYRFLIPLKNDLNRIRLAYDKSIESFFNMFRFLVNFNILTALGFGYILTMHIFDYSGGFTDLCATFYPCFTLYSRFSTNSALRYSFALFLFCVIGAILFIYKWVKVDYKSKRQRFFNKEENFFSREFFNSWDWRTNRSGDSKHNKDGIATILKVMLYEDKKKEIVKQRTSGDKMRIYIIRGFLMTLSIIILLIGWLVILIGSIYESEINDAAKDIPIVKEISTYSAAIILTIVNYIVPKCLGWITECEKWDFAIDQLKHEIWRNYLAQMLNFAIFVFVQLEMAIDDPFIRNETLISFTEANSNGTDYECREDLAGINILQLFVVELIQRYLYYFGWIIYYRIKAKCQGLNNWRKEFETTDEVVWLIYFQSIIWVSFIFYPYLAILAPIVLYIHFKFIFYRLRNWKISPQMVTNQVTTGNYIMLFLNGTFICCSFLYALFLLMKVPHSSWVSDTSTLCGPFTNKSKASQPVVDEITSNSSVKSILESTVAHPIMLVIAIIYAIFFGYDHDRKSSLYKKYIKDKERENSQHMDNLKIERSALNKKLAFLRRQENLH